MDIQPTNSKQPISDDQELAKVLAGVTQQANDNSATSISDDPETEIDNVIAQQMPPMNEPLPQAEPAPQFQQPAPISSSNDLESIKKDALVELRPLVDKLNVSPEEKFDTYLLLLRSTDDKALIGPAHDAARLISDETRKAQALLDIIKEIDYLSGPQQ